MLKLICQVLNVTSNSRQRRAVLQKIYDHMRQTDGKFCGLQQDDLHEFLAALVHLTPSISKAVRLRQIYSKVCKKCWEKGPDIVNEENFWLEPLHSSPVQPGWRYCFDGYEDHDLDDMLLCENKHGTCGMTPHFRTFTAIETSAFVIIVMKRYRYQNGRVIKTFDSCDIPMILPTKYGEYNLCAVCCHIGSSAATSGWILVNDDQVNQVDWDSICSRLSGASGSPSVLPEQRKISNSDVAPSMLQAALVDPTVPDTRLSRAKAVSKVNFKLPPQLQQIVKDYRQTRAKQAVPAQRPQSIVTVRSLS